MWTHQSRSVLRSTTKASITTFSIIFQAPPGVTDTIQYRSTAAKMASFLNCWLGTIQLKDHWRVANSINCHTLMDFPTSLSSISLFLENGEMPNWPQMTTETFFVCYRNDDHLLPFFLEKKKVLIWFFSACFFFLTRIYYLSDYWIFPTKIDLVVYLWTVTRIWSFFSFPMIVKQAWKRKGVKRVPQCQKCQLCRLIKWWLGFF